MLQKQYKNIHYQSYRLENSTTPSHKIEQQENKKLVFHAQIYA